MFGQTAEYALRIIGHLARAGGAPRPMHEIAAATKVPAAYLAKVVRDLRGAELVVARRGPGGGVKLARGADAITLLDVVTAVSPLPRIERCPLGLPEHRELCALHRRLDDVAGQVEAALRDVTIGDLLRESAEGSALCAPRRAQQPTVRGRRG